MAVKPNAYAFCRGWLQYRFVANRMKIVSTLTLFHWLVLRTPKFHPGLSVVLSLNVLGVRK